MSDRYQEMRARAIGDGWQRLSAVMPALVAGIHVFLRASG
jgi:hypothetical protein